MKIKSAAAKNKLRKHEGGGANKRKESLLRQMAAVKKQLDRGEFDDMVDLIELLEQVDLYRSRLEDMA
ncbi:hypothetical protein [Ectobacillus ponti]|uniref:Uncharacterized protein n=1 Tax=Ectobacillus ponti TaxID=2961894 RepID=A0AA41X9P6_9BACI|nr:hypothetical protein [Ectobacillus ponti]MCP8969738.1 hypothetical protein [Ectobacillus ponti]